jgi:hypothetical protein
MFLAWDFEETDFYRRQRLPVFEHTRLDGMKIATIKIICAKNRRL